LSTATMVAQMGLNNTLYKSYAMIYS